MSFCATNRNAAVAGSSHGFRINAMANAATATRRKNIVSNSAVSLCACANWQSEGAGRGQTPVVAQAVEPGGACLFGAWRGCTRRRRREHEEQRDDTEQSERAQRQGPVDTDQPAHDPDSHAAEGAQAKTRHAVKSNHAAADERRRVKLHE